MIKIICDRCNKEIPEDGKIWNFAWRNEREADSFPHFKTQICQKCKEEVDKVLKNIEEKKQTGNEPEKEGNTKPRLDHKKIRELKDSGLTSREIAEKLGLSVNSVRNSLSRYKNIYKTTVAQEKKIDKRKVQSLFFTGWKIKDIAGDMGIGEEDVRNIIKEM